MDGRKKKGKHKKRRNRDGAFLVLAAGVAVLLVAVLVMVILRVSSGDKSRETGNLTENTAESAGTEETAAGSIPAAEESVGTETEHTEEAAGKGSITAVAAEVGSMEDDASGQGSGAFAAITADTLKPEDGETAEATLGIDVSKYQGGNIDWTAVKEAGIDFVIVRVGYRTKATGIIYEDPTARYNMQEAQKNGIKVGAYFFSSAVSEQEAKEEASWLASFISQYRITYPVAYNCEDFKSQDSRQYGLHRRFSTPYRQRDIPPCFMPQKMKWKAAPTGIWMCWEADIRYGYPSIRKSPSRIRRLPPIPEGMICGSIPARARWRASGKRWM